MLHWRSGEKVAIGVLGARPENLSACATFGSAVQNQAVAGVLSRRRPRQATLRRAASQLLLLSAEGVLAVCAQPRVILSISIVYGASLARRAPKSHMRP